MKLSAEEKLMYQVMKAIYESGIQRNIPVAAAFTGTDIDLLFVAVDIAKGQSTGFRNPDAGREQELYVNL